MHRHKLVGASPTIATVFSRVSTMKKSIGKIVVIITKTAHSVQVYYSTLQHDL